jgi:serine/threonine-protein kinase
MAARVLKHPDGGVSYQLGELLGSGGFGDAYRGVRKSRGEPDAPVCVKLSTSLYGWLNEVQFGKLLAGQPRVIQVYDYFPLVGAKGRWEYALITELARQTVEDHLEEQGTAYPKGKAVSEVSALLKVLALLHSISAVHRDLTPQNVFVGANGSLKLGDFGIAKVLLPGKKVEATVGNWWFVNAGFKGRPKDDVFLMGQLLAKLLTGNTSELKLTMPAVRPHCSDARLLDVLEHSIGASNKRYPNAIEMLSALTRDEVDDGFGGIRSLRGKSVAFTGPLTVRRADAKLLVLQAGGRCCDDVNKSLDVLVVGGRSPHYIQSNKGLKILAAEKLRKQGAKIRLIGEAEFLKIAAR